MANQHDHAHNFPTKLVHVSKDVYCQGNLEISLRI